MALREEFQKQGFWLFQRRSYLPLLLLPLLFLALRDGGFLDYAVGEITRVLLKTLCVAISLLGFVIRGVTIGTVPKGTSGRTTTKPKAITLNTMGMYSIVRHPLYLGNFLIISGIMLFVHSLWILIVSILAFGLYYERIMFAEEEFLRIKFGWAYEEWASNTPVFIPDFYRWRKPERPFSIRKVIKKEYLGIYAMIASFSIVEAIRDLLFEGRLDLEGEGAIAMLIGSIFFMVVWLLDKKARFLDEVS